MAAPEKAGPAALPPINKVERDEPFQHLPAAVGGLGLAFAQDPLNLANETLQDGFEVALKDVFQAVFGSLAARPGEAGFGVDALVAQPNPIGDEGAQNVGAGSRRA